MIRKAVLIAIFLSILGCAPSGGFGPGALVEARVELTVHCEAMCRSAGAQALGYAEFIPSHRFQCICAPDKTVGLKGITL